MPQNFSSGVDRMWRLLTSHSFHPWYVLWEKPAQSTWGHRWWKAIPWENRRWPDRSLEEPAMSTILQMWHLRFFPWTLQVYWLGFSFSFTILWGSRHGTWIHYLLQGINFFFLSYIWLNALVFLIINVIVIFSLCLLDLLQILFLHAGVIIWLLKKQQDLHVSVTDLLFAVLLSRLLWD